MADVKKDYFGYDLYQAMHNGNLFERFWHKTRLNKILKTFDYSGKKVLEIGCNAGPVMIPLLKKGYDITGIDISKEDIFKAISLEECVNKRNIIGGPSKKMMEKVIVLNEKYLKNSH